MRRSAPTVVGMHQSTTSGRPSAVLVLVLAIGLLGAAPFAGTTITVLDQPAVLHGSYLALAGLGLAASVALRMRLRVLIPLVAVVIAVGVLLLLAQAVPPALG